MEYEILTQMRLYHRLCKVELLEPCAGSSEIILYGFLGYRDSRLRQVDFLIGEDKTVTLEASKVRSICLVPDASIAELFNDQPAEGKDAVRTGAMVTSIM